MGKELIIEFFSEEIPARMQKDAQENLKNLFIKKVQDQSSISFSSLEAYSTPRRLTLYVKGLQERQEDFAEERRGPRVDAPHTAVEGFLKANKASLEDCEQRETPKGNFYFLTVKKKGLDTRLILPNVLREIIYEFPWPKSMRWAASQHTWIRPLRSGVCVFDETPIEFEVWMGEEKNPEVPCIVFKDLSYGHRFLDPTPFQVKSFSQYKKELYNRHVILDPDERKEEILRQAQQLAAQKDCKLRADPLLLEEVVGLVEWPVLQIGAIDPCFMSLPDEVLLTSMRVHQRYFALEGSAGKLAPFFIFATNIKTSEKTENVIKGNERVLRARLSDAQYFYQKDKQTSLQDHAKKLENVIFHDALGTMAQKIERLETLAHFLAPSFELDTNTCKQAVKLVKADLVTEMVGEFPELQGTMGKYYALEEGIPFSLAHAIEEHYLPKDSLDALPCSSLGKLLAIVDRFDTLAGLLAIGIKPTGSKDPFGLRRATLALIRLLEIEQIDFDFDEFLRLLYNRLKETHASSLILSYEELNKQIRAFFAERLRIYWREQGFAHDVMSAAFGIGRDDSLYVLKKRCDSLQGFFKGSNKAGIALLAAYNRACNIIRIEESKDNTRYNGPVNPDLFSHQAETSLFASLQEISEPIQKALVSFNFTTAMDHLATLKPLIDTYFNDVKVNVENSEERSNRLRTLSFFRSTLEKIADFSKIEDTL
jgi:glycyl-tRNA synthetase beta chain